jgi:hypothetical protein
VKASSRPYTSDQDVGASKLMRRIGTEVFSLQGMDVLLESQPSSLERSLKKTEHIYDRERVQKESNSSGKAENYITAISRICLL